VDRSTPLDDQDRNIFQEIQEKRKLLVLNKIDLPPCLVTEAIRKETGVREVYCISALNGDGIEGLKRGIVEAAVAGRVQRKDGELIPLNVRHKMVLERLKGVLAEILESLGHKVPWDLTALEVRRALDILGEIVGETTSEEVLDIIFSRFCIGK
jgi:tRNA modification GTPase